MEQEEMPDVRRVGERVYVEYAGYDTMRKTGFVHVLVFTRRQAEFVQDELARILAEDWS